jgi:hypothetical protein
VKPNPITKGLFVGGIGMLLVSVLFSINGWPAAEMFAILGSVISGGLYFIFTRLSSRKSNYARHIVLISLAAAIILKSFGIAAAGWLFLITFISFLIWFGWTVLEDLPPSED